MLRLLRPMLVALLLIPALALAGFDEAIDTYRNGNYEAALKQFHELAGQGNADAMYYIAECYRHGYGVDRSQTEAAKWFHMAAMRGNSLSQYHYGKVLEKGEGVQKDLVAAHMWLSLSAGAAPNERDAAYTRRDIRKLERRMTPEQIAEAKKRAESWQPEK